MNAHATRFSLITALVFALAGTARAGFLTISVDGLPSDGSAYAQPVIGGDGNALVTVTAPSGDIGSYSVNGTLDSDPTMYIEQIITNSTSDTWEGYVVTITPTVGWVLTAITPMAPAFLTDLLPVKTPSFTSTQGQIVYSGGTVLPGQSLETHFTFDVTASSGVFGYGVLNFPIVAAIPEPASLTLVGLGAVLLLRRRR